MFQYLHPYAFNALIIVSAAWNHWLDVTLIWSHIDFSLHVLELHSLVTKGSSHCYILLKITSHIWYPNVFFMPSHPTVDQSVNNFLIFTVSAQLLNSTLRRGERAVKKSGWHIQASPKTKAMQNIFRGWANYWKNKIKKRLELDTHGYKIW